jgi:uncharacterized iron-regulated membrane protein
MSSDGPTDAGSPGVAVVPPPPASPATPRQPWGAVVRPLARRVHFLAGITVAPLLLVLCLTGLVYVFSPQIHDSLYAGQLFVAEVGAERRPVAEQVATALAAHPEAEPASVAPPAEADRTTRVDLRIPGQAPGETRTVFVDPYTNYINGELTTVGGRLPANVWLRQLTRTCTSARSARCTPRRRRAGCR